MVSITDREKAIEGHYHHMLDVNLRCRSVAYKSLGLWAAEKLGIEDKSAANDYAKRILLYEYDTEHTGKAIEKIISDFKDRNLAFDKYDIHDKFDEFMEEARREIIGK